MNAGLAIAVVSLLGVIATALFTYLTARRKTSGTIDTTEAETLWAQSNELLNRYKADLESTRTKVTDLEAKVITLQSVITTLESKALAVARKLSDEAAVSLAIAAAEALAQPATGTPEDVKARAKAIAVARTLAAKVKIEKQGREED